MDPRAEELLAFWLGPLDADGVADAKHQARWFEGGSAFDRLALARGARVRAEEAERARFTQEGGF